MIQRIQTVFLFLAIVSLALFLWLPLIQLEAPNFNNAIEGWNVRHYQLLSDGTYIFYINIILTGTAIGLTLINIFLFKKRSWQMVVCWFAIIFIVSAQVFVYYKFQTWVFFGDVVLRKWNLLSLVAIVFEVLAFIYIGKDEETIKSLDRLR